MLPYGIAALAVLHAAGVYLVWRRIEAGQLSERQKDNAADALGAGIAVSFLLLAMFWAMTCELLEKYVI